MPINIFVFGDETHVHAIGWRLYEKAGTDDELKAFLQSKVHDDHQIAARNDLEEPIPWRDFEVMDRLNPIAGAIAGAVIVGGENDVYCLTRIVNGEVPVDDTRDESDDATVPDYLHVPARPRSRSSPLPIRPATGGSPPARPTDRTMSDTISSGGFSSASEYCRSWSKAALRSARCPLYSQAKWWRFQTSAQPSPPVSFRAPRSKQYVSPDGSASAGVGSPSRWHRSMKCSCDAERSFSAEARHFVMKAWGVTASAFRPRP